MKSFLSLAFLTTKLLALLCFSTMGLESFFVSEAKSPCHEMVMETEKNAEDCNACEIAVDAWDQELVETSKAELANVMIEFLPFIEVKIDFLAQDLATYQQYYPPPEVLYKSAFHHPQKTTTLLV